MSIGLLHLLIEAAFIRKDQKLKILESARVQTEIMKNLIRTEHELNIIIEKTYLHFSCELVEISKMLNKWISYIVSANTFRQ